MDGRWGGQPDPEEARGRPGGPGSSTAEPEILPPLGPDEQQAPRGEQPSYYGRPHLPPTAPRPRRRRTGWASAPATYSLVAINIAVYVLMVANGVSATAPTSRELVLWGANFGGAVLLYGQWWRLLTATFVHVGIIHLATNMWCLWNLGLLGEPLLGPLGLLLTYVLTGVAGNLLSVGVHPDVVGAGASGAVFGLAGVLILLLGSRTLPVPLAEVRRLRQSVIYFAVLNFVIGAGTWIARTRLQIDNMAHLGGFLSGLLLGVVLVPRPGSRPSTWMIRQWIAYGGMLLIILLGAQFVVSLRVGRP